MASKATLNTVGKSERRVDAVKLATGRGTFVDDIKTLIAEPEMFAIHEESLQLQMADYGAVFLGRCLPACLITAADYVQAQRERRLMLAEMAPIYDKYDLLVTQLRQGRRPVSALGGRSASGRIPR